MKTKLFFLLISASLILTSCYKEGPAGPVGPSGQDGLNGTNGTDGTNGATPKVYYFDIPLNQFIPQSYNSSWQAYSYINNVTLSNNDLVMVFVNLTSDGYGDNYWQALPHNEYVDNSDFYIEHSFGIMGINDDSGNNYYLAGDIMFSLRTNTGVAPYTNMNSTALLLYNVYVIRGTQGKKAEFPNYVDRTKKSEVDAYINKLKTLKK